MHHDSPDALRQRFHPLLNEPDSWRVVRYEVDINEETTLPSSCSVTFKSSNGEIRVLKFESPRWAEFGSMCIPTVDSLYVAEAASLGWDHGRIEVGEWYEERATIFFADSVKQVL